jgi:ABC-2 type transport system ATP-binding protein
MTTTRTTPISVHGLTKQFGRLRAVEELTFDVRPGQITGFLGPNSAGKTSTLRMLLDHAGACDPCNGHDQPPVTPRIEHQRP